MVVERRWAEGHSERLPALMAEMVERKVDIMITHGTPAAIAAKQATSTIPIVVYAMGDALGVGLVESLARPGRNLTGLSLGWSEGFTGKWIELLQESMPRLSKIAVLFNPRSQVKHRPIDPASHARLAATIKTIPPHKRELSRRR